MIRPLPRSTRTDQRFPFTTLFRSIRLGKVRPRQRQIVGALAGEELRQMHAIVGGARFFTDHAQLQINPIGQRFDELVPDHAMTDDDNFPIAHRFNFYLEKWGTRTLNRALASRPTAHSTLPRVERSLPDRKSVV